MANQSEMQPITRDASTMTAEDVIETTIGLVGGIDLKVDEIDRIGIPLRQVQNNLIIAIRKMHEEKDALVPVAPEAVQEDNGMIPDDVIAEVKRYEEANSEQP